MATFMLDAISAGGNKTGIKTLALLDKIQSFTRADIQIKKGKKKKVCVCVHACLCGSCKLVQAHLCTVMYIILLNNYITPPPYPDIHVNIHSNRHYLAAGISLSWQPTRSPPCVTCVVPCCGGSSITDTSAQRVRSTFIDTAVCTRWQSVPGRSNTSNSGLWLGSSPHTDTRPTVSVCHCDYMICEVFVGWEKY